MSVISNPKTIEATSFKIIDNFLTDVRLPRSQKVITKRVIHATADLNYARELIFHPQAIKAGLKALTAGKNIIVDANMLKAGINKKILSSFGGKVICLINNHDIIRRSSQLKISRAMLAMRKSVKLIEGAIVAIGNSPTALFELCDLVEKGKVRPALIIGLPVGFVGAKQAKKKLNALKLPYITNRSRKGGSSAAAAVINALLILAKEGRRR